MEDDLKLYRGVHALVVEDQRAVISHIDSTLNSMGISSVEWASDGERALSHFRNDPGFADLVISDLTLPGMDGIELLRKVRAINPKIPFLMLLADPTRNNVMAIREAGAKHILVKPFSSEDLSDHVHAMVKQLKAQPSK